MLFQVRIDRSGFISYKVVSLTGQIVEDVVRNSKHAISSHEYQIFHSFLARCDFCHLLITFANSIDPDQDQQNVVPDLDPKLFDILIVFLKDVFEKKSILKKVST